MILPQNLTQGVGTQAVGQGAWLALLKTPGDKQIAQDFPLLAD